MKYLILAILIIVMNGNILAEGLEFQQDLDFGDVPIGNSSRPNIKMLPYKITNNSSEDYYIEHMIVKSNYPNSILNNIAFVPGYIFKYVSDPLLVKSKETAYLNVSYDSYTVDSISNSGNKLSKSVTFFYRKASETILTEDSVKIYARSVPSNPMEAYGFKYAYYVCPSGSKYINHTYFVAVLNNTDTDMKIDSMQISIDGENLTKLGLEDSAFTQVDFVKSNSFARYQFKFDFKKFEKTVAKVKFFATSIDDGNKHYVTEDSTIIEYIPYNENGRIVLSSYRTISQYVGLIDNKAIYVLSCSMNDFILDSVYVKQEPPIDVFYIKPFNDNTFPLDINEAEVTYLSFATIIATAGRREAQVCADFRRKSDDSVFIRCLDILIQGINPTSVSPEIDASNPLRIFPNPSSDFINISIDNESDLLTSEVQIFDLLGLVVSKSELTDGNNRIDISNLARGTYFIKVGDKVEKFVKM